MARQVRRNIDRLRRGLSSGPLEVPDDRLLVSIIFLVMFGLIMIYSAMGTSGLGYLRKQAMIAAGGFVLMLFVSRVDYHLLMRFSLPLYLLSLPLLILVKTSLGVEVNGATRWISIFGIQLQPSEILKPVIVLLTAWFLELYGEKLVYLRTNLITLLPAILASIGILVLTKNLSTAIIVLGISVLMFYVAYPTGRVYGLLAGCLVIGTAAISLIYTRMIVPAYLYAVENGETSFKDFRVGRIVAWLHPEQFPDLSMQTRYSMYAIGSGGLFGRGPGRGMMKYYIPEHGNDFIFAVIGEELGIIGCLIVVFLFVFQVWRILVIARHARDRAGSLIAFGVGIHVALQVIFHIGVTTGALPNTGVSLPYISYGGTALLIQMAEIGIVLNVGRQIPGRMVVIEGGLEKDRKERAVRAQRRDTGADGK